MARKTLADIQADNDVLRGANEHLKAAIRQRDQDFITLEKSHEANLEKLAQMEKEFYSLTERNADLAERLNKMTSDRDSQKSMRDHYSREHDKAVAEIESVHAVLDGIPDAPTRKYDNNDNGYSQPMTRSLTARLAGALLTIARGGK